MDYQSVDSSSIDQVAYDRETSTLGVRFCPGREYTYSPVPEAEYHRLMAAESVGRHFVRHIQYAGYNYSRVR